VAGNTAFRDPLELKLGELEAKGTFEFERYDVAYMYVGLIQTEGPLGNREITAGAYGMGPPKIDKEAGDTDEHEWSLYLQQDSSGGNFDPRKLADGFVVAQLKGGNLIGWLHEGIELRISEGQNP
jgi:hypothetical protein